MRAALLALLLLLSFPAWPANRLADADSPYLRLHAENPVDWYPWGDEAFERARAEDKPVFLSIGYSACYWCRVAEETLYRKPEVAALMNRWFINVKLDREQRPDLDGLYMAATRLLGGRGGWPNNLFLTPDRKPFFAGSYFPPEDDEFGREGFPKVMERVHRHWSRERELVLTQAEAVARALKEHGAPPAAAVDPTRWRREALRALHARADRDHGGLRLGSGEARFPQAPALEFLAMQRDAASRRLLRRTLDAMARGALRDHLGGGFHRYTVDARWSQPHFEKTLYDNAQLLRLYATAGRGRLHRDAARETAQFLLREMQDPQGGFHATLDAVSGGREGAHYLWTEAEIRAVLGPAAAPFLAAYRVVPLSGHVDDPADDLAEPGGALRLREDLSPAAARAAVHLAAQRAELLRHRNRRPTPPRDEKLILAWNGLAIEALAVAGRRLDDGRLTAAARRAAERLWRDAREPGTGRLRHAIFEGRPQGEGFLEDHALFGLGLLALASATGEGAWRERAALLANAMLARFARADGGLAATRHDAELFAPVPEDGDGPYPAGASAAWRLLDALAARDPRYRAPADRALAALAPQVARAPQRWPALLATGRHTQPPPRGVPMPVAGAAGTPRATSGMAPRNATPGPATAPSAGVPAPAHAPGTIATTPPPSPSAERAGSADAVAASARWRPIRGGRRLEVRLRIAPGWHLNANPPGMDGLIATRLDFDGARPRAVRYPPGEPLRAAFAAAEIRVWSGAVTLEADFARARPKAARLTVQACSEEVCLPPAELDLPLP
ncbi:MAG: DUF255 domain-containing protein [Betaproteobacteria bacterium]|nr:DUF255 domain-containing protein [Betaproteobacteria bacterium]